MMLRSSSTPILSSLLSSYSESPNHNHHHSEFNSPKHPSKKLSFQQAGHLNLITPSSYSYNCPPSINPEFTPERHSSLSNGFRRAQSEGNLEALLSASCNGVDEFNTKKFPRKPNCPVLQTIPSTKSHENDEDDEDTDEEMVDREKLRSEGLSLGKSMAYMNTNGLQSQYILVEEERENILSKMHLARGLGAMGGVFSDSGGNGGGHNEYRQGGIGGDGGDGSSIEEYYKRMVEENPGNPLFLRNFAQFLHQTKGDLGRAEEYYSRAILIDPGDGEILSQYARLTWELHHDEERATNYFQRAVQAAPEDSHVLAAYAGFLWETEDAEDDLLCTTSVPLHESIAAVKT